MPDKTPETAQLREQLFDGLVPQQTLADTLGVTRRSIQRMIKQRKIEVCRVGSKTFVVVSSARKAA
jgi:excisionase family DNA binding protein